MDKIRIPPAALWLGLGGLIPFLACTFAIWTGSRLPLVTDPAVAMVAYAALILSFLGGVRWGLALRMTDEAAQGRAMLLSVIPSIAAWLLLLAPTLVGLAGLQVLFLVLGLADRRLAEAGAPPWYAGLRTILTTIVVLALLAAIAGVSRA